VAAFGDLLDDHGREGVEVAGLPQHHDR
jgi:hypothetical protein